MIQVEIIDPRTGKAAMVTSHGELVVGTPHHASPYNATRSAAGVSNIVKPRTGEVFIITYMIVASDKTNVETNVSVYETLTDDGDSASADNLVLSGSLAKNDRVVMPGLDLETLKSRFVNIETDTAAIISVTVMGYFEKESH